MTTISPTRSYAALERNGALVPYTFTRRELRPHDVRVKIDYCGVCHTDLHFIGKWGQEFPLVPGHEIVGTVTAVGPSVRAFTVGDAVLVGTQVDSCRECEPCKAGEESYCQTATYTYDSIDRIDQRRTRGGYASDYVADEHFVYKLPQGLDPAGAAPLVCAGITTFSPLKHWQVGPTSTVGVIGIGGLGHLGVKFARAFGAHVVAFTSSPKKVEEARALGAHEVVLSRDEQQMKAQAYRFDFILDTIATVHPIDPYLNALKLDGTLCSLGLPDRMELNPFSLALGRRSVAGSGAGGTVDTHAMLELCGKHGIVADYELITPKDLPGAFERLVAGDVRYRFVLDLRGL